MVWKIKITDEAAKTLIRLGGDAEKRINTYLFKRINHIDDPRLFGKQLKGNKRDYWCYRVGDYRVVCRLDDERKGIRVVDVGHRKEIYD